MQTAFLSDDELLAALDGDAPTPVRAHWNDADSVRRGWKGCVCLRKRYSP